MAIKWDNAEIGSPGKNIKWDNSEKEDSGPSNPFRGGDVLSNFISNIPLSDYPGIAAQGANTAAMGIPDFIARSMGKRLPEAQSGAGRITQLGAQGLGLVAGGPGQIAGRAGKAVGARMVPGFMRSVAVPAVEGAVAGGLSDVGRPREILPRAAMGGAGGAAIGAGIGAFNSVYRKFLPPKFIPINPNPEELSNMSSVDRSEFFSSRSKGIESSTSRKIGSMQEQQQLGLSEAEARGQSALQSLDRTNTQRIQNLEARRVQLQDQLMETAESKVVKARPAVRKLMGEASQEFRKIRNEELANSEDVQLVGKDIADYLRSKFTENPAALDRAIGELGINPSNNQSYSVKQIVKKLSNVRAQTPFQARAGNKLYNEADMFRDDLISNVSDMLEEYGVDFSRSKHFWASYAPIRNVAFRAIKPFQAEPIDTETGARFLIRGAKTAQKGRVGGTANVISEIEKRAGLNLTDDLKNIIGQMDDAKQQRLMAELNKQSQEFQIKSTASRASEDVKNRFLGSKASVESQRDIALEGLNKSKFDTERAVSKKQIPWKVGAAIGGTGLTLEGVRRLINLFK